MTSGTTRDPTPAAFVILDLDQGLAALAAAALCGRPVTLITPADAGAWLGPDWTASLSRHLRGRSPKSGFRLILDCGTRQALAHEALRRGAEGICFTGPAAGATALGEVAAAAGAVLLTRRPSACDVAALPAARRLEEAVRWIRSHEEGSNVATPERAAEPGAALKRPPRSDMEGPAARRPRRHRDEGSLKR
jgi:hypothetical protein